jgi:hypothetical protein
VNPNASEINRPRIASQAVGTSRISEWLLGAGGLLGLAIIVFWPAMHGSFFWDDHTLLTDSPIIRAPDGLRRLWFTTEPVDYFPLTYSTFWIEWRVWGLWAGGYHIDNVMFHLAGAVAAWRAVRRMGVGGNPAIENRLQPTRISDARPRSGLGVWGAWLCAAIFLVHPVNVESAAWISERKNTLSFFLCALSANCFLSFDETGRIDWYIAMLIAFAAAMFAKTSVAAFPAVVLLLTWYRRGDLRRRDWLASSPMFLISAALALATIWFQTHRAIHGDVIRTDGFKGRFAAAGWAIWFYLYKAAWPANLSFVYPRWNVDPANPASYVPIALVFVTLGILYAGRKHWGRGPFTAAGYYVLMLMPILGFFNIYFMRYSLVSDHWQYPAIIGVIVPGVWVGKRLIVGGNTPTPRIG